MPPPRSLLKSLDFGSIFLTLNPNSDLILFISPISLFSIIFKISFVCGCERYAIASKNLILFSFIIFLIFAPSSMFVQKGFSHKISFLFLANILIKSACVLFSVEI